MHCFHKSFSFITVVVDMDLVTHRLVEEASMSSKTKSQKRITADSIREVTAVGVSCGFDLTMEGC